MPNRWAEVLGCRSKRCTVAIAMLLMSATAISFAAVSGAWPWCTGVIGAGIAIVCGWRLAFIYVSTVNDHWRWRLALVGAGVSAAFAVATTLLSTQSRPVLAGLAFAVTVFGLWPASHLIHWQSQPNEDFQAGAWFANLGTASMASVPALAILGAGRVLIVAVPFLWTIAAFINRVSKRLVDTSAPSPRLTRRGRVAVSVAWAVLVLVPILLAARVVESLGWIGGIVSAWLLALDLVSSTYRHRYTSLAARTLFLSVAASVVSIAVAGIVLSRLMPGVSSGLVSAAVIGLVALGLSFVFRGHGFVALVALGAVVCWVSVDRTSTIEVATRSDVDVLVLGDSYASGEGAESFIKGTNDIGHNECRRATTAFGPVIGRSTAGTAEPLTVLSLACSGALTHQVDQVGQMRWFRGATESGWRPQLDDIDGLGSVRHVLVSIGGNDMLFGAVGRACALPGNCADSISSIDSTFFEKMNVQTNIERVLRAVVAHFPDATVAVVPYPDVLGTDPEACERLADEPLETDEVVALQRYIGEVQVVLHEAADEVDVPYLASVEGAYGAEGVCGRRDVLNLLSLSPVGGGTVIDRIDPTSMLHNSFHPTELGHECVAKAIMRELGIADSGAVELCKGIEPAPPGAADSALDSLDDEPTDRSGDGVTCSIREECIDELQSRSIADARSEAMRPMGLAAILVLLGVFVGLVARAARPDDATTPS